MVVTEVKDNYGDVIAALISSVVPLSLSSHQMLLQPDNINNLRAISIIKIAGFATIEDGEVITTIGKLSLSQPNMFKTIFKSLVD